jgi:phenylacetate 2-hydroxylase
VIDRPTLYTFHGVISSTQGFTIGSSPWDDSCKVNITDDLRRQFDR